MDMHINSKRSQLWGINTRIIQDEASGNPQTMENMLTNFDQLELTKNPLIKTKNDV